jgi:hypothetical protein
MATLTWKDSRLVATDIAPYDTTVMLVGKSTPLKDMVGDSAGWCQSAGGDLNLMIYCHGLPGYLQLCKEGLTARNLSVLSPLKPYFSTVSIHACLIAKGQVGRHFCVQLAHVLAAWVDGAVQLQGNTGIQTVYGQEDDRKYDGNYYRHLPSGEVKGPLRSS